MATQSVTKNVTSIQFESMRIKNEELYFLTDTNKLVVGKYSEKVIINDKLDGGEF